MSLLNTLEIEGYQGCHFSAIGYANMAARMLPVVSRDFYGVASGVITPPNLQRAYFTSGARTAIALEFDQAMSWNANSLFNWYVDDDNSPVSSGSVAGNTVTLQLSSPAAANATIDYLQDDSWSSSEPVSTLVHGVNGLPAFTFADVPIETLTLYEAWINLKNLTGNTADGEADPDFDGLKNALEFVLGGEPNPSAPGSNSSSLMPIATHNSSGDLIFSFQRKTSSVSGVDLSFRWSTDLIFPATNTVQIGAVSASYDGISVAISSLDAETDSIVITVPESKVVDGKLFGRLSALLL